MSNIKRSTDRYLELHAQGLTNSEIARACGVWPSAVSRYFRDNGITRNGIAPGSKHEKALRRAHKRKLTYRQAAKEMGLSPRYVSAICKRLGIKLVDGRKEGNNRAKGGARELPKVKPLEWEESTKDHESNEFIERAVTPIGTYFICYDNDDFTGFYLSLVTHDDARWWGHVRCVSHEIKGHHHDDDLTDLKAAAQADYDRRILSALAL